MSLLAPKMFVALLAAAVLAVLCPLGHAEAHGREVDEVASGDLLDSPLADTRHLSWYWRRRRSRGRRSGGNGGGGWGNGGWGNGGGGNGGGGNGGGGNDGGGGNGGQHKWERKCSRWRCYYQRVPVSDDESPIVDEPDEPNDMPDDKPMPPPRDDPNEMPDREPMPQPEPEPEPKPEPEPMPEPKPEPRPEPRPDPPSPSPPPPSSPPDNNSNGSGSCSNSIIQEKVALDNQVRGSPMKCDNAMSQAAYQWSKEMCERNEMSHRKFRENCDAGNVKNCRENVLYNFSGMDEAAKEAHKQWMDSSGHKENILASGNTRVGYGWYKCGNGRMYWTGLYGS